MSALADDVVMVVSEVVTNAIVHAKSPMTLSLHRLGPSVRGQVTDHSTAWPTPLPAGMDEEHGRGLAIVAAYADRWGVTSESEGKAVWFVCGETGMSVAPDSIGLEPEIKAERTRMTIDFRTLLPIAEQAVTLAGEIVRTRAPGVVTAKGDRDMATEVDYAVEHAVREFLSRETPQIGFLGEEEGVTHAGDGLMWALDPVDGTANFLHGLPLCGVSLGLIDGDASVLGVIELPFLATRYTAAEGGGARANGVEIRASDTRELGAAIVSIGDYAVGENAAELNRPRLALTQELAARVQRVRMFGSAAIDLAWVAQGRTDALVMLGNNPWDTAAGVLIAREAGAAVVDVDGSPHTMTAGATIAAAPRLVADLVELLAEVRRGSSDGPAVRRG